MLEKRIHKKMDILQNGVLCEMKKFVATIIGRQAVPESRL
jgi:hypothetical protein